MELGLGKEMKIAMKPKRQVLALMSALAVLAGGWGAGRLLGQGEMMEMMKQKKMNRPAAMKNADETIQAQKQKAIKAGKYACCLKHSCDFCALKMGECTCGMNAAKDMPVCNECKGGWHAGDGAVPGKTADQIKTMPRMGM
jgi:hypothetical protein